MSRRSPCQTVQEDLRSEYYLWQVHNVVQDIDKAEAEVAKDDAKLAGLESTIGKSEGEVSRGPVCIQCEGRPRLCSIAAYLKCCRDLCPCLG